MGQHHMKNAMSLRASLKTRPGSKSPGEPVSTKLDQPLNIVIERSTRFLSAEQSRTKYYKKWVEIPRGYRNEGVFAVRLWLFSSVEGIKLGAINIKE